MNEQQIFAEARLQDSATLDAFLSEKCGGDEKLKRRVERLLDAVSGGTHLFDRDPVSILKDLTCNIKADSTGTELNQITSVLESLEHSESAGTPGRLGHYEIRDVVGSGGFGVVLRAIDEKLMRPVAIKVLSPALASNAEHRERFLCEARSAAAIRHDNVVRIYAVEHNPIPYIVMEFIEGRTLQKILRDEHPLPPEQIASLAIQIAQGLEAAHAAGIVHRDIKPANILVETGDVARVKLTDFGLAYPVDAVETPSKSVLIGTPAYMAPEQARGAAVDHRSDLFSLGSVLYAMCCGRPAFSESNTMALLESVARDQPLPLGQRTSKIPPSFVAIIERLHQKDPAQRYQSTAELVADLRTVFSEVHSQRSQSTRWRVTAVAVMAVLALTVSLKLYSFSQSTMQTTASTSANTPEVAEDPAEFQQRDGEQQVYDVIVEMTQRNPDFDPRLTDYEITDGRVTSFRSVWTADFTPLAALTDLENLELFCQSGISAETDLSFVSGMKNLKHLKTDGLPLAGLAPLKGLPITELSIWCWNWNGKHCDGDLSALRGMPLTRINAGGSMIQSLEPLRGAPLVELCLNQTSVKDLSPLSEMHSLRILTLAETSVEDLTPLAGLRLKELELADCRVKDLSALEQMPLQILSIMNLELKNYAALQSMPLMSLRMNYDPVRDLAKLDQLSHVQQLNGHPISYYRRPEIVGKSLAGHLTEFAKTCAANIRDHF